MTEARADDPLAGASDSTDGHESSYRALFERATVGLFRTRLADGAVLLANPAAARVAGFDDPLSIVGTLNTLAFYRRPEDRTHLLRALVATGEVNGTELELMRCDGSIVWVRVSARLAADEGWVEGVIEDITVERRVSSELRRSQLAEGVMLKISSAASEAPNVAGVIARVWELLGEVIDTRNFYVALYDEEQQLYAFPFYHDQYDELSEFERLPLPNSLTDWVRRAGQPAFVTPELHRELIATGEVELVGTDSPLWLGVPLKTEHGVIGVMVVQSYDDPALYSPRDLELLAYAAGPVATAVERKRAEEQHAQMAVRLSRMQKLESLGVLAGGIAHDFNNLLQGIVGSTSLARLRLDSPDGVRPQLDRIERAAESAAELVRQMLAYAGRGAMVVEDVDLAELVRDMEPLLRTSVAGKAALGISVASGSAVVAADISELRQLVLNLVTNASEAQLGAHGAIRMAVSREHWTALELATLTMAETGREGTFGVLEVCDDGPGMTVETQARMFEPFYSTKFVGRGMGLAAVHGIVRGVGGAIDVDSAPGHGTRIRVLLPIVGASGELGEATQDAAGAAGRRRVLVVDDDQNVRETAAQLLELAGFGVATAEEGRAAVEMIRRAPAAFDVVLLDLVMPQMDGREAFAEIKLLRPGLPVVLTSGYREHEAIEKFGSRRPAGFLQKPFRFAELIEVVERVATKTPDEPGDPG